MATSKPMKIRHRHDSATKRIWINVALIALFIFVMFPLLWVLGLSFKGRADILSWPPPFIFTPTLDNYMNIIFGARTSTLGEAGIQIGALDVPFMRDFANSLIITVGALLVSLAVGIPAAYALARFRFKGREDLAFTFLSFRFAPELLIIIPLYMIFQTIGLYNNYIGMIWVYQLITLPMIIWLVRGYIEDIPVELEQASCVDGYSRIRSAFRVTLPLLKPAVLAASLLSFVYAWNNFVFALILGGGDVEPITVAALKFMRVEDVLYGNIAAGIVLSIIPTIVLAFIARGSLVRGLTMGAVKR